MNPTKLGPARQQAGSKPKLPKAGAVGGLLLIRNTVKIAGGRIVSDKCSLWLCVPPPGGLIVIRGAQWQEVKLGTVVNGTE